MISAPASGVSRQVGCDLLLEVDGAVRVDLQIAAFDAPATEILQIVGNGTLLEPVEISIPGMGRTHTFSVPPGRLEIVYRATVKPAHLAPAVSQAERIVCRRPSRYAESDRLAPIAQREFAGITDPADLLADVSSWVGSRLDYVAGSSGPTDGAVDTMLKRKGVCRDYAHLVIALLRALDIPARLAAVYAPGLSPMDFHAVAEAAIGETWYVVDATLLAPRSSLVRIATGRDAADTAFLSTYGGRAELLESQVTAVTDGPLPTDDVATLTSIN